jgi:hypothetical protein
MNQNNKPSVNVTADSETSNKKKIYNERYTQKQREGKEQLKQIKTVLGIKDLEVEKIPGYIKARVMVPMTITGRPIYQ